MHCFDKEETRRVPIILIIPNERFPGQGECANPPEHFRSYLWKLENIILHGKDGRNAIKVMNDDMGRFSCSI